MPLSYVLGFPAVLVCIVATASMAFRFGWQFGAEPWEQWSFALGLAAMDVIKAFLLLAVAGAWRARQYGRVGVALAAFAVFTGLSLLSSFGMAAIQSALKIGSHTAVASIYNDRKAEVDRLVAQRECPSERLHMDDGRRRQDGTGCRSTAVGRAGPGRARQRRLQGAVQERQAEERTARTALLAAQADHAATVKAEELDGKIAAARTALEGIDATEVAREGDPQAAALAVLLGRFIGDDKALIRSAIHAAIAIGLEIGSGFGLFALFGHHGRRREDEAVPDGEPATSRPVGIGGPAERGRHDRDAERCRRQILCRMRRPGRRPAGLGNAGVRRLRALVRGPEPHRRQLRSLQEARNMAHGADWRTELVPRCCPIGPGGSGLQSTTSQPGVRLATWRAALDSAGKRAQAGRQRAARQEDRHGVGRSGGRGSSARARRRCTSDDNGGPQRCRPRTAPAANDPAEAGATAEPLASEGHTDAKTTRPCMYKCTLPYDRRGSESTHCG